MEKRAKQNSFLYRVMRCKRFIFFKEKYKGHWTIVPTIHIDNVTNKGTTIDFDFLQWCFSMQIYNA